MLSNFADVFNHLVDLGIITDDQKTIARSALENLREIRNQVPRQKVSKTLRQLDLLTEYQAERISLDCASWLRCGPYVLLDCVGYGQKGEVFKAQHQTTNQIVALKVFRLTPEDCGEAYQNYLHEVRILEKIKHNNLINLYDHGYDSQERRYYLAMEYIDGANLDTLVKTKLKARKQLTLADACEQIRNAAKSLTCAHEQGIVHRDIKPRNLVATSAGSVAVVDFGLARLVDDASAEQCFVGTPEFVSPEMAEIAFHPENPPVDHRSDIYGLGCTFYFLCTGKSVVPPSSLKEVLLNQIHLPAPRLQDARSDVPDWLENIFQKMVAKQPENRFQSLGEFLNTMNENLPSLTMSHDKLLTNSHKLKKPMILEKASQHQKLVTRVDNPLGLKMIWLPADSFLMGIHPDDLEKAKNTNENQVRVTFTQGFWLSQHLLTQAQWQQIMGTSIFEQDPYKIDLDLVGIGPNYPMYYVHYRDSQTFCQKLTAQEQAAKRIPLNWSYQLPTEAQWEYACRAGSATHYFFGNDNRLLGEYAWFCANSCNELSEIGLKKSNPWEFHDMLGNLWEWCRDAYVKQLPGGVDPFVINEDKNEYQVCRGGCWDSTFRSCWSASRHRSSARYRTNRIGFRVALVQNLELRPNAIHEK